MTLPTRALRLVQPGASTASPAPRATSHGTWSAERLADELARAEAHAERARELKDQRLGVVAVEAVRANPGRLLLPPDPWAPSPGTDRGPELWAIAAVVLLAVVAFVGVCVWGQA